MNRVALVQMVSSSDPAKNLPRVRELVSRAAEQGASHIFLPENFAALGNPDPVAVADNQGAEIEGLARELARETGSWLFAGTMPLRRRPDGSEVDHRRVRAASLVIDPDGKVVARYDKIHMFDVDVADRQRQYRESATFEPGTDLASVVTPLGCFALTVCYDIRFPELYRAQSGPGIVAFTVPSAFTVPTGAAHFEVLMRARAIESFSYTIAACQGGRHDSGRETYGHSMIVDPWGEVLVRGPASGEAVLTAEIDLDRLHEVRERMPVFSQRRLPP